MSYCDIDIDLDWACVFYKRPQLINAHFNRKGFNGNKNTQYDDPFFPALRLDIV